MKQKSSPATGRRRTLRVDFSPTPQIVVVEKFKQDMSAAGFHTHEEIVADNKIHRLHADGDKTGSLNIWYIVDGERIRGQFGSWKSGEKYAWTLGGARLVRGSTPSGHKSTLPKQVAPKGFEQIDAQARAMKLWARSAPASEAHQYLRQKQIRAHGARQLGERLVIPLRDGSGTLCSLLFIAQDGTKRFLARCSVSGLFCLVGGTIKSVILLAEGFATAASLYEATGYPAVAACSAGNLSAVAQVLRSMYPAADIVLCADNDSGTAKRTGKNTGVDAAREAANLVGGHVAIADFTGLV